MHSAIERMTLGIVLTAPLVLLGCAGSPAGPSNANTPAAIQTISAWLGTAAYDPTTATGVPAGATTIPVVGFPNGQVSQPRDAQGKPVNFGVAFAFSHPDVNRTMVSTLSMTNAPPNFGGRATFSEGNIGFAGCVTYGGGIGYFPYTFTCTLTEYDSQGTQFSPSSTATLTVVY